jgi:hypothetical protein
VSHDAGLVGDHDQGIRFVNAIDAGGKEMSSTLMIKVGGVAAVLAGSLRVLSDSYEIVFGRVTPGSVGDTVTSAAHAAHLPLLVFAIVGVHLLQQRTVDAFGQACTLLAIFGMMFLFGGAWAQSFLLPGLRGESSTMVNEPDALALVGLLAGTGLFVIGLLLWGVAILRARVLPAWPAVLLIVGVVAGGALKSVFDGSLLPLNVAIICIGVATLSGLSHAKSAPSEPVAAPV